MARGKQVAVKAVEEVPIITDDGEELKLTITGKLNGFVRFEPEDLEPFEVTMEDLIDALLFVDTTGGLAHRILTPSGTNGTPAHET